MYYTYILYSPEFDKIYIGHTDNLEKRLERHNLGLVRSTKAYLPWELIYFETFDTRAVAMKRERELKSHQGRNFIRESLLKRNSSTVESGSCRINPAIEGLEVLSPASLLDKPVWLCRKTVVAYYRYSRQVENRSFKTKDLIKELRIFSSP
jgi:putative endonuclease